MGTFTVSSLGNFPGDSFNKQAVVPRSPERVKSSLHKTLWNAIENFEQRHLKGLLKLNNCRANKPAQVADITDPPSERTPAQIRYFQRNIKRRESSSANSKLPAKHLSHIGILLSQQKARGFLFFFYQRSTHAAGLPAEDQAH
jgi:hypothetical protein